jgi:hypothetical protein
MSIREDKSYLSSLDLLAIEKGIAKLDIYSLRIDREPFTEEQKEENHKLADRVSSQEWAIHCEESAERTARKIEPLIEKLSQKFIIHQYKDNSMEHYGTNWDLFFWCNGNNKGRDYSYVTLSTNTKRTVEERQSDIEKVLEYIQEVSFEGIDIAIQYTIKYDDVKVRDIAIAYYQTVKNKFIDYMGIGKIKEVGNDDNRHYGFFKKGASRKYYRLSDMSLLGLAFKDQK